MIAGKTVSLCMVVYNSADLAEKAIASVRQYVDDVVIVDQGSDEENSTKLKSLSTYYCKTTNKGNADYDRMYCYALAPSDFILALDADESVPADTIANLERNLNSFEFDICWFLFDNWVSYDGIRVNLSDMLKDDPHPRFWRKIINIGGKVTPPIIWSVEAHTMPRMLSDRQIFSQSRFTHDRNLDQLVRTHLHRGQGINPQAQQLEKSFVQTVLNKFPDKVKTQMNFIFPELKNYLK